MTKMELYYYDMSIVYLPRLGTCYNRSMLELELVFVIRNDTRVDGCSGEEGLEGMAEHHDRLEEAGRRADILLKTRDFEKKIKSPPSNH